MATGIPTALAVATEEDERTITIDDATGFVDGNIVGIFEQNGPFYYGEQVGVAVDLGGPGPYVITLDTPIDSAFPIGSAVLSATDNMAVKGDVTTKIFQIGSAQRETTVDLDITRFNGYIQDDSVMDDGKFGGLEALTFGVVLRIKDGTLTNMWNVKSNGDFGLLCFDTGYDSKPPSGDSHGFRFRNTYAGPSKHGVTIRLFPGEVLQILIQDDLTGLEKFNMIAQGHVVGD
jgi:hypothetical protein